MIGNSIIKLQGVDIFQQTHLVLSNVNLHIDRAALLQFTADKDQYPLVEGFWEGVGAARNQSPISANNATNIAITGMGIVDGNGDVWRAVKKDKLTETQWKNKLASGGLLSEDKKNYIKTQIIEPAIIKEITDLTTESFLLELIVMIAVSMAVLLLSHISI